LAGLSPKFASKPKTFHPTIQQLGADDPPSNQLEFGDLKNSFNEGSLICNNSSKNMQENIQNWTDQNAIKCEENYQFIIWVHQQATAINIPYVFQYWPNDSLREFNKMELSGKTKFINVLIWVWNSDANGIEIWWSGNPPVWRNLSTR
jgi:hypothetical protein